jgi:hypothetical protein
MSHDKKLESKVVERRHPNVVLRRPVHAAVNVLYQVDLSSHGYVPLLLWLALFFGGIWFPATSFLRHYFEGGNAPNVILLPVLEVTGIGSLFHNLGCLGACMLFWSWTNLALLCVMSSTMGEINRTRAGRRFSEVPEMQTIPEYRIACTRAFVVYLIALVNGITFSGTLVSPGEASHVQGTYIRVAILASITSFLVSYRPEFFDRLLNRFSATGEQQETTHQTTVSVLSKESKSVVNRIPEPHLPDEEAGPMLKPEYAVVPPGKRR